MATPPPSERGITRRHVLATAGALVFAPLAAACESLEERERAAIATATAEALRRRPPTPVLAPTQRPPEQPTVVQRPPTPVPAAPRPESPFQFPVTPPIEGLRTDEERAKAYAVFEWLKSFSIQRPLPQSTDVRSSKAITGSGTYGSYAIGLTDANTWVRRIPDIARATKQYKLPQPLQARWTTWWVEFDNPRAMGVVMFGLGVYAGKYTGEVQADSIEMRVVKQDPTPADRASGITWMGTVGMEFATKFWADLQYVNGPQQLEGFRTKEADLMKSFITSQGDSSPPQFSGWQNDGWRATVKLKQGRWEVESGISGSLSNVYSSSGIGSPLYGIDLPVRLVDPVFATENRLCTPNAQSGCRLKQMKLPQ